VKTPNTKLQTPESKHQTPNTKHQRSSKLQTLRKGRGLELGTWDFFGVWSLVFGVSIPVFGVSNLEPPQPLQRLNDLTM
jgi:hypothetical protein